jgi:hypothetical protein
MAVPRPFVLTLLGMVLLAATFLATRNANTGSEKAANPVVPAQPKPAQEQQQTPAQLSPQDAIRALASPGSPLQGARVRMRLVTRELGGRREVETLTMAGSFAPAASNGLQDFELRTRGTNTNEHVIASGGRGYFVKGRAAYKLPDVAPKAVADLKKALGGGSAAAKSAGVDPARWFRRLTSHRSAEVDGVEAVHVSGKLDGGRMARDIRRLARSASTPERPTTLPRGFGRKLDRAFDGANVHAHVGARDRILRRLRIAVNGVIPAELRERGETAHWRTVLELRLSGVNKPQKIQPPKRVSSKALGRREQRSAVNAFAGSAVLVDPPAGVAQTSIGLLRVSTFGRARRVPRQVERAITAKRKVVLFFYQRRGLDDVPTAAAVASLRRRTKASVFSDSIDNLAAYGRVVQSLGLTRAPSIVIIGRRGRARLIDGYIDPAALAQEVADTR